jgi:hypothetical protein
VEHTHGVSFLDDRMIVTAQLEDGTTIHVEARRADPEVEVGIGDILDFKGFAKSLESIVKSLSSALQSVKPDKTTVELGVDIGVESGALTALLVKGTGSGSLKVTLEWDTSKSAGD